MPRDAGTVNFIANARLRTKFLTRYMGAHSKHLKAARRKKPSEPRRVRTTPVHRSAKAPPRPVPKKEELPKSKHELKALAPAKPPEFIPEPVPLAVVVDQPAAEEPAPRSRDRGAYDSDTAIKLYLREIGLVKLLTPQEEI